MKNIFEEQYSWVKFLLEKTEQARKLYHQLVLVVAPPECGKTNVLNDLQLETKAPLINVSLELAKELLELSKKQRALQAGNVLKNIIMAESSTLILLDNTEILFEPCLKQDPLRLLQKMSRNKTIVASWSGTIEDRYLTYAKPGYKEFQKYPANDLLYIHPSKQHDTNNEITKPEENKE